jgi:hypothetical protein
VIPNEKEIFSIFFVAVCQYPLFISFPCSSCLYYLRPISKMMNNPPTEVDVPCFGRDEEFVYSFSADLMSNCNEQKVLVLVSDLHGWKIGMLRDKTFIGALQEENFVCDNLLGCLTTPKRNLIKIIIYSCVIREYILRTDATIERTEQWRARYFSEIHPHLIFSRNEANSLEPSYLTCYFRAIVYLLEILTGTCHKGIFLRIGYALEGSGQYHGSGGSPSLGRIRREKIFNLVTGTAKRIRRKRSIIEVSSPLSTPFTNASSFGISCNERCFTPAPSCSSSSLATPSTGTTDRSCSSYSSPLVPHISCDQRDAKFRNSPLSHVSSELVPNNRCDSGLISSMPEFRQQLGKVPLNSLYPLLPNSGYSLPSTNYGHCVHLNNDEEDDEELVKLLLLGENVDDPLVK